MNIFCVVFEICLVLSYLLDVLCFIEQAHKVWTALWSKLDANHSGDIDDSEFKLIDTDGNGLIDTSELMRFMQRELDFDVCDAEKHFASFVISAGGDVDKNESLSLAEIIRFRKFQP